MQDNRPLIIVMTPVRNEAWVLRAFLEATSLWADYIIIADQMSTDGSREIAKEYSKVILIDNNRKEMHQAATRRLLFEEAKKIEGDKILFALDADEFLAGDFVNLPAWKTIMESKPNDAFCWRWLNLSADDHFKCAVGPYYFWAVHASDDLWNGIFPDNYIHEWRLPWPPQAVEDNKYELDNLFSIHLAWVNPARQSNKERFYQVSTVAKEPKKSKVGIFRQYHYMEVINLVDLPESSFKFYEDRGLDIWRHVDFDDDGDYYTTEVLRYFERDGVDKYALLDIWNDGWISKNGIVDPRTFWQKWVHKYLNCTCAKMNAWYVQAIDKLLKFFV